MKVYVVIGRWDHEGYHAPIGVFSTPEKAQAARTDKNIIGRFHYNGIDVLPFEIDQPYHFIKESV